MELLFVIIIAAGLGFVARYSIPGRDTHGPLLLAAVSAIVAAVVWVLLLWLARLTFDGGWIWVISLTAAGLAAILVATLLPRRRRSADRALLTKLSGGRA